jgi:putative transposase
LIILNYTVTSNHIHLLVFDDAGQDVIPRSMQLIAGRTGQEYNRRKARNGAFWEDRYHATAVEKEQHLIQCMTYIDLNMVRAGVVDHPSEWPWTGYNELLRPKSRYRLIDYQRLMHLLNFESSDDFSKTYKKWVEATIKEKPSDRDSRWTQSIATGSQDFVESVKQELGVLARGRQVLNEGDSHHELKETPSRYGNQNYLTRDTNTLKWDVSN